MLYIIYFSCHYKDEDAQASPPTSPTPPFLSSNSATLLSGSDYRANSSTTSLLQTERGSLTSLYSDDKATDGWKHTSTVQTLPDEVRLNEYKSCLPPRDSSSADFVPSTCTIKENYKYPPPRTQDSLLSSSFSGSSLKPSEETRTRAVPDELEVRRSSLHSGILQRKYPALTQRVGQVDSLSSSLTSCSLRQRRYAEKRSNVRAPELLSFE